MFVVLLSIRDQLETNQVLINKIPHNLVVHSSGEVLSGNKKECATDTYKNLVEAQKHYGEQNQPEHTVQFLSCNVIEEGGPYHSQVMVKDFRCLPVQVVERISWKGTWWNLLN